MQVVLEANPKLLIFVEGVERNACVQPGENCWWGGHIAGHAKVSYHGALNRFVVTADCSSGGSSSRSSCGSSSGSDDRTGRWD